jgi:hypothetical protein
LEAVFRAVPAAAGKQALRRGQLEGQRFPQDAQVFVGQAIHLVARRNTEPGQAVGFCDATFQLVQHVRAHGFREAHMALDGVAVVADCKRGNFPCCEHLPEFFSFASVKNFTKRS